MKQPFEELKVLCPVRHASLKIGIKLLKLHMLVVEKHLACSAFDRMKAHLIADGRDQDKEIHPDQSSPTVAIHSVFTVLVLVPGNLNRLTLT